MKPDPMNYFRAKLKQVDVVNSKTWVFSLYQCLSEAIKKVDNFLLDKIDNNNTYYSNKKVLPAKVGTPLSFNYWPELDTISKLNSQNAAYYWSLIGILRWMVKLDCVDICVNVLDFSSCLTPSRIKLLKQLFHIFSYLKSRENTEMVFDPNTL